MHLALASLDAAERLYASHREGSARRHRDHTED